MFSASPEVLHAGEANLSVFAPILGDSSVISLEEGAHLERRRLLLPPFHGEQVLAYFQDMCDCAGQIVGSWPIGRPFSMHHEAQRITLRVILKVIFGVRRDAEHGPLARLIISLANVIASPLIFMPALQWDLGRYSPWGKIMRINQQTDIAIYEAIKRRRAAPLGEGEQALFALLLEAKREDGQGLSDREARDELVTMLLAGHETTATALAWTFERILSLPKVYAKVMEELDIVFSAGAHSPDRVPKLEYLDAVIKETHRFRPIMPIG
ncbi:MAG: cytochrome P450, partial [Gammaproteobacteria bacterium]